MSCVIFLERDRENGKVFIRIKVESGKRFFFGDRLSRGWKGLELELGWILGLISVCGYFFVEWEKMGFFLDVLGVGF